MSPAALALPTVVFALFLGTAWLVAVALLPLWIRLTDASVHRARHSPLVVALPWLVGATVSLAALLPGDPHLGQMLACHCLQSMPAWLHLCPSHPEKAATLAVPAAAVLLVLLPHRLRALGALLREPIGQGGGGQPRVVALNRPVALLHGWLRPTLVIDRGLWDALSPPERAAVLAHERGHLQRRDPLLRVLLQGALVLAPRRLARPVLRAWLNHAEQRADSAAAQAVGDSGLVAQALLRCARIGAHAPEAAVAWTGGDLERRVHALLRPGAAHRAGGPDLGVAEGAVIASWVVAAVAATPWIHHQVEHLLNLPI